MYTQRLLGGVHTVLVTQDDCTVRAHRVSWFELTVAHLLTGGVFPVLATGDSRWVSASHVLLPTKQTLAVQLRAVRLACMRLVRLFGMEILICQGLSFARFGFAMLSDALIMGFDLNLLSRARERLTLFTVARLVRTAAGLARPLAVDD